MSRAKEWSKVQKSTTKQQDHCDELLEQCLIQKGLGAWNELADEVKTTDNGLALAIMSGRPELVKVAKPRSLTEEECARLYHLIGTLLETNKLLQQHAEMTAQMVENWMGHFKGLLKSADKIDSFAKFKLPFEDDVE